MTSKRYLLLAVLMLLALPYASAQAFPVGIYIGGGPYYRPYWGGYYYYRPGFYVVPPPIVVGVGAAPAPVVVTPASPTLVTPPPVAQPTPSLSPSPSLETVPPPQPAPLVPIAVDNSSAQPLVQQARGNDVDLGLRDLTSGDSRLRADAAIRLGRMKAQRAVVSLEGVLAADREAEVRDAAARALGLIGLTGSIPALQRAAQVDTDRGVRSSAQFAIDVIRTR